MKGYKVKEKDFSEESDNQEDIKAQFHTCSSVGFHIVIKPSFGQHFNGVPLLVNPTTLTRINGVTSLSASPAACKAFSRDFCRSDCLNA